MDCKLRPLARLDHNGEISRMAESEYNTASQITLTNTELHDSARDNVIILHKKQLTSDARNSKLAMTAASVSIIISSANVVVTPILLPELLVSAFPDRRTTPDSPLTALLVRFSSSPASWSPSTDRTLFDRTSMIVSVYPIS